MCSAAVSWKPGMYDAEFHRLNAIIGDAGRSLPGYLGVELWRDAEGRRRNATYYWDSLDSLEAFSAHPMHQQVKREYARWYAGDHIVVSQVLHSYGDDAFEHVTPNARAT